MGKKEDEDAVEVDGKGRVEVVEVSAGDWRGQSWSTSMPVGIRSGQICWTQAWKKQQIQI